MGLLFHMSYISGVSNCVFVCVFNAKYIPESPWGPREKRKLRYLGFDPHEVICFGGKGGSRVVRFGRRNVSYFVRKKSVSGRVRFPGRHLFPTKRGMARAI